MALESGEYESERRVDPLGTCSMLPREKEGVVDPKLKASWTNAQLTLYG